jgi:heme exporter protein C
MNRTDNPPHLIYRLASPNYFYDLTGTALPWLGIATVLLFAVGLPWGLAFAPADYQQGDSFRIIYVHVPAAAFSMGVYVAMAITGAIGLIWRIKVAAMVSRSCAPIGAAFTLLALVTGALWGKPMWGAWWVWDARLTSELILLFLYLGYMGLQEAIEDRDTAARAGAVLALVGLVNIPIIHYSVEWWHTLHQGATIFKLGKPSMAPSMLWPLLVMMAAFCLLAVTVVLMNARNEVLARKLGI